MFVGKLKALFSHSIASLVMAECACAIMIFTFLLMFSLWFVLTHVFQLAHFFQHFPFIGMVVVSLDLMLLMRSLLLSELTCSSFLRSFNELLEFFFTASQQTTVVHDNIPSIVWAQAIHKDDIARPNLLSPWNGERLSGRLLRIYNLRSLASSFCGKILRVAWKVYLRSSRKGIDMVRGGRRPSL